MRARDAAIVGLLMLSGGAPAAQAAQTSAGYVARVTIATSCAITVGDLDFGMVGTISSHTATAPVQVNCSSGTPYQISFSGVSPITSYAGTMTNGAGRSLIQRKEKLTGQFPAIAIRHSL